jgi:oligoribonuclease
LLNARRLDVSSKSGKNRASKEMSLSMRPNQQKLFWIDLEMTGLAVEKEVIIECAALVTDYEFRVLDTYEAVVNQPNIYLERMDDWNREHHSASGLTAKVPFGKTPDQVEEDLLNLLNRHWPKIERKEDRPILAGNSIAQDRLFIDKYFTRFAEKLHYRMLDVSSFKIIFNNKFDLKYQKQNAHRALDDIKESVEELKYYLRHFDVRES